jgi:hypothetical protein
MNTEKIWERGFHSSTATWGRVAFLNTSWLNNSCCYVSLYCISQATTMHAPPISFFCSHGVPTKLLHYLAILFPQRPFNRYPIKKSAFGGSNFSEGSERYSRCILIIGEKCGCDAEVMRK